MRPPIPPRPDSQHEDLQKQGWEPKWIAKLNAACVASHKAIRETHHAYSAYWQLVEELIDGHEPSEWQTLVENSPQAVTAWAEARAASARQEKARKIVVANANITNHRRVPIPHKIYKQVVAEWNAAGRICSLCGQPVAQIARIHVHHEVPVAWGGTNDPENLRVTHVVCNKRHGGTLHSIHPAARPGTRKS